MSEGGGGSSGDGGTQKMNSSALNLVEDYGCSDSDSGDDAGAMQIDGGHEGGLSEMVMKNNIINRCAHGPLSAESAGEEAEAEARHIIIDSSGGGVIEYSVAEYRDHDSDDSVSSDSSSDVNSVKDAEELSSSAEEDSLERETPAERAVPRVRGELALEDLPPIEELSITVPPHQTSPIGKVFNIIDKLVIVQAFPETPTVDLDSVLFLDKGQRTLGKVFDVFGPVKEPHYCVRFNSSEQIRERLVEVGTEVFIAPQTDHTNFLFVSELMKMKGSDASWLNDVEPPPGQVEYSDDEEERRVSRARRERRRPPQPAAQEQSRADRRPAPTRFEEEMNKKNLQRTAEANSHVENRGRWFHNPFGGYQRRPPAPAPPHHRTRPWGGAWPAQESPAPCPPYIFGRPVFNPYIPTRFNLYGPPPCGNMAMRVDQFPPGWPIQRGRGRGHRPFGEPPNT